MKKFEIILKGEDDFHYEIIAKNIALNVASDYLFFYGVPNNECFSLKMSDIEYMSSFDVTPYEIDRAKAYGGILRIK